jgi:hypothetical protein
MSSCIYLNLDKDFFIKYIEMGKGIIGVGLLSKAHFKAVNLKQYQLFPIKIRYFIYRS